MQDKILRKFDREIGETKAALAKIGAMRPGGLTQQYHKPATREGGYWQLSYTHRRKSYSENVREEELEGVREELEQYRQFKELCARWVDLSLGRARRQRDLDRRSGHESGG